jgi:hypothetical protein
MMRTERNFSRGLQRYRRDVGLERAQLPLDALQALMQLLAGLGRHHAAAAAHEQRGLKLVFDRLDLPAERRLRHPQRLRGAAEIAMLDHRKEVLDFPDIHRGGSGFSTYTIIE